MVVADEADEVSRTVAEYESDARAYVQKYCAESIAARYGTAFFDALEGTRVLDVGCGPGSDLATFESAGYDVIGLDITPSFLRAVSERLSDASLVRGDMRRLPFRSASFDGIWSSASFLHVPRSDAIGTLREFRRVLRPGGVVFLSVKREAARTDDADERHFEYYRPEELRSTLRDAALDPTRVVTDENWVSALAGLDGRA